MTARRERLLREGLDGLERACEAFDDPVVDDLPGLRLMRDAVSRKRDDMREKLAEAETCRLDVVVAGAAVDERGVEAALHVQLLEAVVAAIEAVARTLAPDAPDEQFRRAVEVRVEGTPGDGPGFRLRAADTEVRTVLVDGDGTPVVEATFAALVSRSDDDVGGGAGIAEVAGRFAATVRLVYLPPFDDPKGRELGG